MNDLTKYHEIRPQMRVGDAISWKGKGLISGAISLWSHRTHVSAVFKPFDFEGDPNRITILEAWENEFNLRALSKRLQDYNGEAYYHQLRPELDEYREDIAKYLFAIIGTPYDYHGLIWNMFGLVKACEDKLFCSEAVGYSLMQIPIKALKQYLPHNDLLSLISGKALRPGGIARLPLYLPEKQLV